MLAAAMSAAAPTALVLGAQGVLGSAIAGTLAQEGWQVVRAGRRPQDDSGIRLVDLDRPHTLRQALEGVDLVANPVPDEGLAAERVVLERGPALVNVAATPAQRGWALQRESAEARGLVLIHAGMVPGVTSLVAADLLRAHPDADELELAFTISASGTSGRSGAGLIHGYLTATSHHPTFEARLGSPLGTRTCFEVGPEERGWLSDEVPARVKVRLGIYFRERPLQALFRGLNRLRLMAAIPRAAFVAGRRRVPDEPTSEPIADWVAVNQGGRRVAARTIQGGGDYRLTAASALVFGEALLELRGTRTGVFAPEQLFTLEDLRPAFERRGLRIAKARG